MNGDIMEKKERTIQVTRTYLQILKHEARDYRLLIEEDVRVERIFNCTVSFFQYLYAEVGRGYHWVDRLTWSDDQVCSHISNPDVSLWVMYFSNVPAGYFELQKHKDGSVEIAYFGLLPDFHRRGLGKYLLTVAIEKAWLEGANRVWLHTCTLDDPAAMPNYIHRGFKPFKEERYDTMISTDENLRVELPEE